MQTLANEYFTSVLAQSPKQQTFSLSCVKALQPDSVAAKPREVLPFGMPTMPLPLGFNLKSSTMSHGFGSGLSEKGHVLAVGPHVPISHGCITRR